MCPKIVALTGSPGTGKSTLAALLKKQGFHVVTVERVAQHVNALTQHHGLNEIDTAKLMTWAWNGTEVCIVDGHLSHHCSIDAVIVLRCNPSILRTRLSKRSGYDLKKIESNVEWELLGGVWSELLELHPNVNAIEIDTSVQQINLESVLEFLSNPDTNESVENLIPDSIDWISI